MKNTNLWDFFVIVFFLTFLLSIFSITAYLVEEKHWSCWTFLLALLFVPSIKTGMEEKSANTKNGG